MNIVKIMRNVRKKPLAMQRDGLADCWEVR